MCEHFIPQWLTYKLGHCGMTLGRHTEVRCNTYYTHIHLLSLRMWHIHTYLAASAAVCPSPNIVLIGSSSVIAVKFFMFVNC